MSESKKNTSVKLGIHADNPPQDLLSCLSTVFWKEPDLVAPSAAFLSYVRDWARRGEPHLASDWKKYCARSNLSQSQYSNMLKRLRRAGMVEKRYNRVLKRHEIVPSDKFSTTLRCAAKSWTTFLNH